MAVGARQGTAVGADSQSSPHVNKYMQQGHPSRLDMLLRRAAHPVVLVLILALIGVLLHHRWLTSTPLAVADWNWVSGEELKRWFPWPSVWEPEVDFGRKAF